MRRSHLFPIALAAALALVLAGSVEFRSLKDKRAQDRVARFNPAEYARDFWDHRLAGALDGASEAGLLIGLFNTDMKAAVAQGRTLGQSRVHAYLLRGEGQIVAADKDGLLVSVLPDDPGPEVLICTGPYISGNAVRDASGLVDVSAFSDTMRFNRISAEINKIMVQEVILPFLEKRPQAGMQVRFIGAAEVSEEATEEVPFGGRGQPGAADGARHLLRIVPVQLELE